MNFPLLSRRNQPASDRDMNGDGRVDADDATATTGAVDRPADTERTAAQPRVTDSTAAQPRVTDPTAGRPRVTDRETDRTTYRSSTAPATPVTAAAATDPAAERTVDVDRERADLDRGRRGTDRDGDGVPDRRPADLDGDGVVDRREADLDRTRAGEPVVAGPKPRASLLATLGLILGVAGALFVLTGALAGYGIGLGAVGAVLSVLGLIATRRRHIAGKTDALFGILFGLGAVVLGVLAMTGIFAWPTTDGDWVARFREWLDSQFVNRF
ncbi:thrombospondin [Micromonospora sp. NPDC050686]|uniref:thrombospondin n=1 Tax=Micromonospora sp. NPDC050686 TaxID=3154631 RepID=UPI0034097FB6